MLSLSKLKEEVVEVVGVTAAVDPHTVLILLVVILEGIQELQELVLLGDGPIH